jgi:hypothetical protein
MDVVFLREKYSRGGPHYEILLKKKQKPETVQRRKNNKNKNHPRG